MAKLLVVEDNAQLANAIALVLPSFGYEVRVANDGAQALTEAIGFLPQSILLDIQLPSLDGIEVARRLRRMLGSSVRMVAYTARPDITLREATDAGCDEMLVKPVTVDEILSAIEGGRSHR
jgi:CheY-like chemotaxis protein